MHPSNRAERRHQRERVIASRRFIWEVIWGKKSYTVNSRSNPINSIEYNWQPDWGRYAKWNLNCGCAGCHREKYLDAKSQRRKARKTSWSTADCRVGDRTCTAGVPEEDTYEL